MPFPGSEIRVCTALRSLWDSENQEKLGFGSPDAGAGAGAVAYLPHQLGQRFASCETGDLCGRGQWGGNELTSARSLNCSWNPGHSIMTPGRCNSLLHKSRRSALERL